MKSVLYAGFFVSLLLVFDQQLGDAPYAVLLLTLCLVGIVAAIRGAEGRRTFVYFRPGVAGIGSLDAFASRLLLWCWIPIVLSWFLGAVTGLMNGAPPAHVARNFFGLLSYGLLPVLVLVGPGMPALIKTTLLAGLVQCAIGLVVVALSPPDITQLIVATSISDLRTLYSAGFIVVFPVLSTALAVRWLLPRNAPERGSRLVRVVGTRAIIALAVFALVVTTMSKGFILATVVLIVGLLLVSAAYACRFRGSWWPVVGATSIGVVILLVLPPEIVSLIGFSFGREEAGNSIRAEQYGYLVDELTWFGAGLGSALRSGFNRGDPAYAFELTYVNLVQKLGIWSVFLFLAYLLTVCLAMWRLWKRLRVLEAAFSIGCMGFLVVGAANPMLLSPTAVTLHCIAIYVLIRPYLVYVQDASLAGTQAGRPLG